MSPREKAKKIVDLILEDMTDRRGFRQAWDEVDEDIRDEIKSEWRTIAFEIIAEI